ncbi:hypothetical protein [Sphingobacterium sp. HMA12]|uniref:hypothetical protein n=1 Tax=Sphingobacterium sp. HMA12 TaxID=2050894 RepID=UPI000CE9CE63|nr:hypothetical protein [Sphingobacterium sp. HMA12]
MTNQTISKAFNTVFNYPIWRIEIDAKSRLIAVETRNPADTRPYFNVITFEGDYLLQDLEAISKEWVLAGIQCHKLILKKISSNSPIDAGVHVIDCYQPDQQETWFNYLFVEMVNGGLRLRPKMIEQGMQLFLDLKTMSIENKKEESFKPFDGQIVYPINYNGQIPQFLTDFTVDGEIWISALDDYFIWAFYEKNTDNHYQIRIVRSTKERLIDAIIAVDQLPLKFFNIYFLVNKQIFLLTDNKREFVSYLV